MSQKRFKHQASFFGLKRRSKIVKYKASSSFDKASDIVEENDKNTQESDAFSEPVNIQNTIPNPQPTEIHDTIKEVSTTHECTKPLNLEYSKLEQNDMILQELVSHSKPIKKDGTKFFLQTSDMYEFYSDSDSDSSSTSSRSDSEKSSKQQKVYRKDDSNTLKNVFVERNLNIEKFRSQLPAIKMEQEVIDLVINNDISLITGQTGCGKSTQVPQFLYEAGFCSDNYRIGVTQPRRVAVCSLAQRLQEELNSDKLVGHQVRFDHQVSPECRIKFMTDGILMKEIQSDMLCQNYSVIILDESHERSVNCDILLGLLSRIVITRRKLYNSGSSLRPLRLVIMSATMKLSDFTKNKLLFCPAPPMLNIDSRLYPVTVHFSRTTDVKNMSKLAAKKAWEIHKRLGPGSILIFATGKRQIEHILKELSKKIEKRSFLSKNSNAANENSENEDDLSFDDYSVSSTESEVLDESDIESEESCQEEQDKLDIGVLVTDEMELATKLGFDSGATMESVKEAVETYKWLGSSMAENSKTKVRLIPLYAKLSLQRQKLAFDLPEPDERVIIVSTNVAETSLTLPNIRYVIDCGQEKQKHYIHGDTSFLFKIDWISKASADQRAGRAGRLNADYPAVKLNRVPLDGILLYLASIGMTQTHLFPFPTPPHTSSLLKAKNLLVTLGALKMETPNKFDDPLYITFLGRLMTKFPIPPRLAAFLIATIVQSKSCKSEELVNLIPACCCLVSALAVGGIYESQAETDEVAKEKETTKKVEKNSCEVKKKSVPIPDICITSYNDFQYIIELMFSALHSKPL